MKCKKALLVFAAVLLIATPAFAGTLGVIKAFLSQNVLGIVAEIAVAIAGIWWGGAKLWKKAFKEALDVPIAIKKARDEKSPGGKEITEDEAKDIAKETAEAATAAAEAVAASRKK